jgi:hypothetical protein
MHSNPIPSNDKTVDSVQRGDSGDHDDRGDAVAFNKNDNEDLRSTQYGTHYENQDDVEVNSQERSLVQANPRKRKRNGVNAKYSETIIAIEKQKATFFKEAMKNRQPENEDLLFLPHVSNIPANMKLRFRNRMLILQLLQHSSPAHFHCHRLQPHLLLIVHHQNELPRRLLCLRIPVRTTRFTSKCHPSGAHPNPTNTQ